MYLLRGKKKSVQVLCPFFDIFLLLSYMRSLDILDIKLLSDMWFANFFSVLVLLIVSFDMQKLLSLI